MATAVLERKYLAPTVQVAAHEGYEENQVWFVVPIGIVAYFGGAALWCKYVCRNNGGVKSCSAHYVVNIKAVCKS